jgi:hypothetical protein
MRKVHQNKNNESNQQKSKELQTKQRQKKFKTGYLP